MRLAFRTLLHPGSNSCHQTIDFVVSAFVFLGVGAAGWLPFADDNRGCHLKKVVAIGSLNGTLTSEKTLHDIAWMIHAEYCIPIGGFPLAHQLLVVHATLNIVSIVTY